MNLNDRIQSKLDERNQNFALRNLYLPKDGIDFWSNDYLGYASFTFKNQNYKGGSTGSRLISGNSILADEIEQKLATFFNAESALLFNSGYDANVGLLSCLPLKNDVIIYDEHIHASMRDGIRLSFAKHYSFKHNSLSDLEKKIKLSVGRGGVIFVCIESLYSMGGDFSPLKDIIELCEKYDAYLILDEAHSGGIYGENGQGFAIALELEKYIFARVYTFGKAFGCHGAVVVGNQLLKDYLVNFSRSFIYTTALPEFSLIHIQENIQRKEFLSQRKQLFNAITFFRKTIEKYSIKSNSEINSPIQMLKIGDAQRAVFVAEELRKNGFLTKAILSPTVAKGEEAIRICLHAFNTEEQIEQLIIAISRL